MGVAKTTNNFVIPNEPRRNRPRVSVLIRKSEEAEAIAHEKQITKENEFESESEGFDANPGNCYPAFSSL